MLQENSIQISLLIIDSDPEITKKVKNFFSSHELQCFTAKTAQEAIDFFHRQTSIRIILTDLYLSDMDGITLIDQLKKEQAADRNFDAILFTEHSEKNVIIQALRAGFTDFYSKPLDLPALLKAIQKLYFKQQKHIVCTNLKHINLEINLLYKQLKNLKRFLIQGDNHETIQTELSIARSAIALDKLTPRQREVAYLAADGLTNQQIATTLSIQENTVKLYISQILKSTSQTNRTQLSLFIHSNKKT